MGSNFTLLGVSKAAAAGGLFAPDDVTGLWAWYKADAESYVDNDPVGTLTDQSGNGRNATQATSAKKPTFKTAIVNGEPVYRFDGTDDNMPLPDMSALTAGTGFVVVKRTGGLGGLWDTGTSTGEVWTPYTDTNIYDDFGSTVRKTTTTGDFLTFKQYVVVSAASDWRSYIDGVNLHTTATNTVGFLAAPMLGSRSDGSGYYGSDITEVILYSTAVGTSDRQNIEAYLAAKYAIPLVLRPNADVSNQWTLTGPASAWDALDDVVDQPAAPVTATDHVSEGANGESFEVHVGTHPVSDRTVVSAKLWAYAGTSVATDNPGITLQLREGANVLASTTVPANSAAAWRSATYTGSLTQAQIDDLRVHGTKHGALGTAHVYAAYVELTLA